MGYDVKRFIGVIDQEFLCCICKMVLENPVQIPCEHLFCYECLKNRIVIERTCPVDCIPIVISAEVSVFQPPCMAFRNLLYKLNMVCDFHPIGCTRIVKLEDLVEHVKSCEYNADAEIVCDQGCQLKVTRTEYIQNDCLTHSKHEMVKLNRRIVFQKKRFEGLANSLYDRITKLNEDLNSVRAQCRTQKEQYENVIKRQQQQILELRCNRRTIGPLKWQICHNLNFDDANNLKIDDYSSSTFAFGQSYHCLTPARNHFQIKLAKSVENAPMLTISTWIGLTRKGQMANRNPATGAICFIWNGRIQMDHECIANGPMWEEGDTIKLGIKFRDSEERVRDEREGKASHDMVCLHRNEKLVFERRFPIPREGYFPAICIYGKDTNVSFTYS